MGVVSAQTFNKIAKKGKTELNLYKLHFCHCSEEKQLTNSYSSLL